MKEFIDKLKSRLKEKLLEYINKANDEMIEKGHTLDFENFLGHKEAYENVLYDIVNQLAEEYKGGWIPCDKELPTTEGTYWATLHDVQRDEVYVRRVHWNSFFKRWLWDNGKPLSNLIEVVAWQNIYRPEPYTEGVRK